MHYLQTEYTKSERDRINWELERCEMKSRIAQLEGENRDLKSELVKLQNKLVDSSIGEDSDRNGTSLPLESWDQEEELLNSKLSVQENIKEIVYLLKSPPVTDQLEALNDKDDPVKKIESLNLFKTNNSKILKTGADIDADNKSNLKDECSSSDDGDLIINDTVESTNANTNVSNLNLNGDWKDIPSSPTKENVSDAETVINTRRSRSSSLFSTRPNENLKFHTYRFLQYHLSPISKFKLFGNSMLSFGSDGLLKHWLIEPSLNSNENATKAFHCVSSLLGIFWLSKMKFMTVDETSIKLWNVNHSEPLVSWDGLKDLESLQSVDFKNKWLILTFANEIRVWEIKIGESTVEKVSEYTISVPNKIIICLLGLTEKSLIVLNGSSKQNVKVSIFDFQGSLLQQIDISHGLTRFHATNNEVALNRFTSELLVRFDTEILIYSFDQKKTILVFSFTEPVVSSIFLNDLEYTVTALKDGSIIVKSIREDGKQITKYNHYENPEKIPAEAQPITISSTVIDDTPVIVSGGYNGVIRLEKIINL